LLLIQVNFEKNRIKLTRSELINSKNMLIHKKGSIKPGLLASLVVVLAISFNPGSHGQDLSLDTATVVSREVARERVLEGIIEATNSATVSAQTSGRISEVNYDVNDFVPKGSILIRLRGTEQRARVAQSEAEVRAAQARLQEASTGFERAQNLYAKKNISKSAFDTARTYLDTSRAQIEAAQAAVEQAREQLLNTVVRAPFDGVVTERHVEVGESVSPGEPLMTGFSLENLRVRVDVPQQLIYAVRELNSARILHPDPAQDSMPAESITIFPYANEDSNTFTVRIALPSDVTNLFPGMLTKVAFITGKRNSLVIPSVAVIYRSEVVGVYVLSESGAVRLRQVRTGRETGDGMIEVLSGLKQGERVALDPIRAGVSGQKTGDT